MGFDGIYVLSAYVQATGYRTVLAVSKTMEEGVMYASHHAGKDLTANRSLMYCYLSDVEEGVCYEVEWVHGVDWLMGGE